MTALACLLLLYSAPAYERAIEIPGPGRVAVVLDRDVYDGARADLGDLRVVDDAGGFVPHWLERAPAPAAVRRKPQFRNRAFVRGRSAAATLDFAVSLLKRELVVVSAGDNFRRRVMVEGSAEGRKWVTLTDDAFVFAVPGPEGARYERVPLPVNDYRYLRVTVHNGPDDPETVRIESAWVAETARPPREERLAAVLARAEDALHHETVLSLDLGARRQPFVGIVLDVLDPRFFRGVVVEAHPPAPRPGDKPGSLAWERLAEGAIYRYADAGRAREALRLDVTGRERALRLRIRNRDDRPLTVRGTTVIVPVERVVFEAAPGRNYGLTYGSTERSSPEYDLGRTIPDLAAWAATAREVRLGPSIRLPSRAPIRPWTERHPALLWAGLLAAVGALGALTWRAVRASP